MSKTLTSALWSVKCLATDSLHVLKAPAGRRLSLLAGLFSPKRAGFCIQHPEPGTAYQLYREIFARQCYYFFSRSEAPLIFDCGANVGAASLYFKWLYRRSRVRAFEADPATFALLRQNIMSNRLSDVTAYNCALWDQDGEIEFFSDPQKPSELSMSTDRSFFAGEPIKVPARRLSEFVTEPVDFLKMDIEGAEHRVIEDLVSSGKISLIRSMTIEYHHRVGGKKGGLAGFLKRLEQSGFEYRVHASLFPSHRDDISQAMFIACYRD